MMEEEGFDVHKSNLLCPVCPDSASMKSLGEQVVAQKYNH